MARYRKIDNSTANRNLVNANIKLVDENKDLKYKIEQLENRMNTASEYIDIIEEKFATQEFISIDKKLVDLEHVKEIKKILKGSD